VEPAALAARLHLPDGGVACFKPLGQMPEYAALLAAAVTADPSICTLTDADGERYVPLACLPCRRAMETALFLLGRFDVDAGPPKHFSGTAAVVSATDHASDARKPRCALKAMREAGHVLAEVEGRYNLKPEEHRHSAFIVEVLALYVDTSVADADYNQLERAAEKLQVPIERAPLETRLSVRTRVAHPHTHRETWRLVCSDDAPLMSRATCMLSDRAGDAQPRNHHGGG
jgi:hypothetical protein